MSSPTTISHELLLPANSSAETIPSDHQCKNNNENEPPTTDAVVVLDKTPLEDDLLKFDDDETVVEGQQRTAEEATISPSEESPAQTPKDVVLSRAAETSASTNSLVEVPLHESSDEELNEMEDRGMGRDLEDDEVDPGEHADHLSPLMMDNHTVVEHLECFSSSSPTPAPIMVVDSLGNITVMRHSETKDSLSSLDSDTCMSFDRQQSSTNNASANSSSSSSSSSSSDNDPARDSGCETGPCVPSRPYCPVEADENITTAEAAAAAAEEEDELHTGPFEVPNEEFSERIVEQVEFYFSNESILKDAFLLKHVRRNKEGFVSLKLVSSFKRVRQLTKDWRVVGHAIQLKSKTVELNDVGTKVRRIEALPSHDETMPSRTVVATDLSVDKITIEKAYEMFSKCGEIALVRIMRVGGPIPADVRQFINKYPELLQKECALVEFVESRSARNALAFEGVTVLEMVAPKKKTGKKSIPTSSPSPHLMTRGIVENNNSHGHQSQPSSLLMFPPHGGNQSGLLMDQERSRGGAPLETNNSTTPRFQIRRAASGYYSKPDQVIYVPPPRKYGYNHGNSFAPVNVQQPQQQHFHVPQTTQYHQQAPTFIPGHHHQNHHHNQQNPQPHFHNHHHHMQPTESYEIYRRTSAGHIVAVSPTNKFNPIPELTRFEQNATAGHSAFEVRRGSHPLVPTTEAPRKMHSQQPLSVASPQPMHECQCQCQSQSQGQTSPNRRDHLMFRRMSANGLATGSPSVATATDPTRKLSVERKVSVTETNWRAENNVNTTTVTSTTSPTTPAFERKYSTVEHHQSGMYPDSPIRKFSSNGFDPLRKLSNVSSDEYVNGRRISTDSGYDRKYSFSSDCSGNARSRSNSFICNHAPVMDQIIRVPQGPAGDGSRGFGQRTRKIGQILPPI